MRTMSRDGAQMIRWRTARVTATGSVVVTMTIVALAAGAAATHDPEHRSLSGQRVATDYAEKAALRVWRPAPASHGERVYAGFGVRTLPAPAHASPAFSAAEIVAIADRSGGARGLRTGVPDVQLRRIFTGDFEGQEAEEGPLAWVLTYQGSPAVQHGRYSTAGRTTRVDRADDDCQFTYALDARTAAELLMLQS